MKKLLASVVVFCSLVLSYAGTYEANLDGLQSVPPNASPAFGFGEFSLTGSNLTVNTGTYTDLLGGATTVALNNGAPGIFGTFISALTLDTPGAMTGTYSGTVGLTLAQISDLDAGNLYVLIRSSVFPSGEIRGQLFAVVPEPTTAALAGVGALIFFAQRRRK